MSPYLFAYSGLCRDDVADAILNDTEGVTTWPVDVDLVDYH
jgi:hypothetical protein